MNHIFDLGRKNPWILYGILISPVLIILIGCLVLPSLFYDQFIWKYFWGPIVSDALEQQVSYNGIAAAPKFTLVSETIGPQKYFQIN
jgi:hypothetical protein